MVGLALGLFFGGIAGVRFVEANIFTSGRIRSVYHQGYLDGSEAEALRWRQMAIATGNAQWARDDDGVARKIEWIVRGRQNRESVEFAGKF